MSFNFLIIVTDAIRYSFYNDKYNFASSGKKLLTVVWLNKQLEPIEAIALLAYKEAHFAACFPIGYP